MVQKTIVASVLVVNSLAGYTTYAQSSEQPTIQPVIESVAQLADQLNESYQVTARAQLAMTDILIRILEMAKAKQSLTGLEHSNVYVTIPLAIAGATSLGLVAVSSGVRVTQSLTPKKSTWFSEYQHLLTEEKAILSHLKEARADKNADTLAALEARLDNARARLMNQVRNKPGLFYKFGRAVRGAGYTAVALGGVAFVGAVIYEGVMITMGVDELDSHLNKLRKQASLLETQI